MRKRQGGNPAGHDSAYQSQGDRSAANGRTRLRDSTLVSRAFFVAYKVLLLEPGDAFFQKSAASPIGPTHGSQPGAEAGRQALEGREMVLTSVPEKWRKLALFCECPKKQGFSHREADAKSLLDDAFRRGMGGARARLWRSSALVWLVDRVRPPNLIENSWPLRARVARPRPLGLEKTVQAYVSRRFELPPRQGYGTPNRGYSPSNRVRQLPQWGHRGRAAS